MSLPDALSLSEITALHMTGRLDEAEYKYRELLQQGPGAVIHNNLGFLLSQKNRLADAITEYRSAIALSPDYATAYTNLGQTLLQAGMIEEAGTALGQAVELDPDDFYAARGIAKYYMIKGQMQEAGLWLRKACSLRRSGELLLDLSWCLLSQGQLDECASVLGYAEDLEKDHARYHSIWGLLHFTGSNFGQAVYCFRQALGLEPDNIDIRNNLVVALLRIGNTDTAMEEMKKILQLDPAHIESLNNLAVIGLSQGHSSAAWNYLNKVLEMEPGNEKALFYKATICLQRRQQEEATQMLKEIVKNAASPYYEKSREALGWLDDKLAEPVIDGQI